MSRAFQDGLEALKSGNFKKASKVFSKLCISKDEIIRTAAFNNWIWSEMLLGEYFEANNVLHYMKEQGAEGNSFTLCLELMLEYEILKDKLINPREKVKLIIERYYEDKQVMVRNNHKSERDFQEERGTMLMQVGLLVKAYEEIEQFYNEELSKHDGNLIQYCAALTAYGVGHYSEIERRVAAMSEPEPFKKALKETFLILGKDQLPKLELDLEISHFLGLLDYSSYLKLILREDLQVKPYELLMLLMIYSNSNKDMEEHVLNRLVTCLVKAGEFGLALGEFFLQAPEIPISVKYIALDALIECGVYQINTPVAVNCNDSQAKTIMSSYISFIEDDLITLSSVQQIRSLFDHGDLDEAQKLFTKEVLSTGQISEAQIEVGLALYSLVDNQQMYQMMRQIHESFNEFTIEQARVLKESFTEIKKQQNQIKNNIFNLHYGPYLIKNPVNQTEAAYLGSSKVNYLRERLSNWQVSIPKNAKKSDLINLLINNEERVNHFMKAVLTLTTEESTCLIGILDRSDVGIDKESAFRICLELLKNGLVYAVKQDDGCKIVVPVDLEPLIRSILVRPDYQAQQHLINKVRFFLITSVDFYGFIPIRLLHQILQKVDPVLGSQVNEHIFNMYFEWVVPRIDNGIVSSYEGHKVLMAKDLMDYEGSEAFKIFASEILYHPKEYYYPSVEEFYKLQSLIVETPEALKVTEILEKLTNDYVNYFGVFEILHDLRLEANFMNFDNLEKEALQVLEENEYDFSTKNMAQKAGEAAERYIKTIPLWRLKGHSILLSKVAIKQSGETVKVGRNDPCPCGSGKKYKKCCGA